MGVDAEPLSLHEPADPLGHFLAAFVEPIFPEQAGQGRAPQLTFFEGLRQV